MFNGNKMVNPFFWKRALSKDLDPAMLSVIVWACLKMVEEEDSWGTTHNKIWELYRSESNEFWALPYDEKCDFVRTWNGQQIKINLNEE